MRETDVVTIPGLLSLWTFRIDKCGGHRSLAALADTYWQF
jgi:hypothetical protein